MARPHWYVGHDVMPAGRASPVYVDVYISFTRLLVNTVATFSEILFVTMYLVETARNQRVPKSRDQYLVKPLTVYSKSRDQYLVKPLTEYSKSRDQYLVKPLTVYSKSRDKYLVKPLRVYSKSRDKYLVKPLTVYSTSRYKYLVKPLKSKVQGQVPVEAV